MTRATVIQKITSEMLTALQTEADSQAVIEKYIGWALDIGTYHFDRRFTEVIQMNDLGSEIARFNSVSETIRKTGISESTLAGALCGRQHSAGGYLWKYNK